MKDENFLHKYFKEINIMDFKVGQICLNKERTDDMVFVDEIAETSATGIKVKHLNDKMASLINYPKDSSYIYWTTIDGIELEEVDNIEEDISINDLFVAIQPNSDHCLAILKEIEGKEVYIIKLYGRTAFKETTENLSFFKNLKIFKFVKS